MVICTEFDIFICIYKSGAGTTIDINAHRLMLKHQYLDRMHMAS